MNNSRVEKINFYSNILGKEMPLLAYLPEGYDRSIPLPVLYFLHGRSGSETILFEVDLHTNEILKEKEIPSQNHLFPGNHSVAYIQSNIEKHLKFYGC